MKQITLLSDSLKQQIRLKRMKKNWSLEKQMRKVHEFKGLSAEKHKDFFLKSPQFSEAPSPTASALALSSHGLSITRAL